MVANNNFESAFAGPLDKVGISDNAGSSQAMLNEVFQSNYRMPQSDIASISSANQYLPSLTLDSGSSPSSAKGSNADTFVSAGNTMLSTNIVSEISQLAQEWEGLDSGNLPPPGDQSNYSSSSGSPTAANSASMFANQVNQPFRMV